MFQETKRSTATDKCGALPLVEQQWSLQWQQVILKILASWCLQLLARMTDLNSQHAAAGSFCIEMPDESYKKIIYAYIIYLINRLTGKSELTAWGSHKNACRTRQDKGEKNLIEEIINKYEIKFIFADVQLTVFS